MAGVDVMNDSAYAKGDRMSLNRKTRAAVAAFSRLQNRPVMGCQIPNGKLLPALHAPYTVSRFTPHEQAIKEHMRRGNAMPQPSPIEQAPLILDPANAIETAVIGEGFVPLADTGPLGV